jgi:hypothetical protein
MSALGIRYFNQEGIVQFENYLQEIEDKGSYQPIGTLLEDPSLAVPIERGRSIELHDFSNRFECGRYFFKLLEGAVEEFKAVGVNPVGHRGLWTWFAAASIENLLKNSKGNFFVGARERYVLSTSARRDYRHLLYGPWLVYSASIDNPDLVMIALKDPVTKDSPVFEQLASRKEIVSNVAALSLVNKCYRQSGSNEVHPLAVRGEIAGGLRRFGAVYSQLAVNFDLHDMSSDQIESLLPREFRPWVDGVPPSPSAKGVRKSRKSKAASRRSVRKGA